MKRVMIEGLDRRVLLSGLTFDLSGGVLTITGTEGFDDISIGVNPEDATTYRAGGDGVDYQVYPISSVNAVVIRGLGGGDMLGADEFNGELTIGISVDGGDGNDILFGGSGNDTLMGGAGKDLLSGLKGSDLVEGGRGNDRIFGGEQNDTLFGNAGHDKIDGGSGDDSIVGGRGRDQLNGNAGMDQIFGGREADTITGGADNDVLGGGRDDDRIDGGDGDDDILGNGGTDAYANDPENANEVGDASINESFFEPEAGDSILELIREIYESSFPDQLVSRMVDHGNETLSIFTTYPALSETREYETFMLNPGGEFENPDLTWMQLPIEKAYEANLSYLESNHQGLSIRQHYRVQIEVDGRDGVGAARLFVFDTATQTGLTQLFWDSEDPAASTPVDATGVTILHSPLD